MAVSYTRYHLPLLFVVVFVVYGLWRYGSLFPDPIPRGGHQPSQFIFDFVPSSDPDSHPINEVVKSMHKKLQDYTGTGYTGHSGLIPFQTSQLFDIAKAYSTIGATVTVCETGFNAGHSAVTFLSASERIRYIGWDDGTFPASKLGVKFLNEHFPNRTEIIFGNSHNTIRDYFAAHPEVLCDIVVVDGDHSYKGVLYDVVDFLPVSRPGAPVFIDDCHPYDTSGITKAFNESVQKGSIVEVRRYDWGRQKVMRSSGYCVGAIPLSPPSEPYDGCPVAQPIPTTRRVIFTTLVAPGWPNGIDNDYLYMLNLWVQSIRAVGIPDQYILVMYVSELNQYPKAMKTLQALNVNTIEIPSKISKVSNVDRYKYSMSKFWVWKLKDYDQVAFFDLDYVFLRSPSGVFEECGEDASFCAGPSDNKQQLNAGFFVIKPDEKQYEMLLTKDASYVDQHVLNDVYTEGKWKRIREDYNWVIYSTPSRVEEVRNNRCLIGLHIKWMDLARDYKEKRFPWNRFDFKKIIE